MAYGQNPRIKNPYEADQQRSFTSPQAGAPIGPSAAPPPRLTSAPTGGVRAPAAPVRSPATPPPGRGQTVPNPYQPPIQQATTTPQTNTQTNTQGTPGPSSGMPQQQAGQATRTVVPNQGGGFAGYGQGGVWSSSVVDQGGGIPANTNPSGQPTTPAPKQTIRDRMFGGKGEFAGTVGGMKVINPTYASPDAQWVLDQLKAAGVTYLPGAQAVQTLIRNGVPKETALAHYQSIVKQGGDAAGWGGFMAGHGANYRPNYETTQQLKNGMGIGTTGWNESKNGEFGAVPDWRRSIINQMRAARGQAPLDESWGRGGQGDVVLGGGEPEPIVGGGGGRGTETVGPRGSSSQGPGRAAAPDPFFNPYTIPPQKATAPGMGGAPAPGGGGGGNEEPPPEEPPERGKTGVTPDWVSPGLINLLYNLYGSFAR